MDAPPTQRDEGDECDGACCRPRERAWKPADAARGGQRYRVHVERLAHDGEGGDIVTDEATIQIVSEGPYTARGQALSFAVRQLDWRHVQARRPGEAVQ